MKLEVHTWQGLFGFGRLHRWSGLGGLHCSRGGCGFRSHGRRGESVRVLESYDIGSNCALDDRTRGRRCTLLERNIINKVLSTFYAICEKDVARGGNGDNVRVFAKWLEGYGVVDLASSLFARVIEANEV